MGRTTTAKTGKTTPAKEAKTDGTDHLALRRPPHGMKRYLAWLDALVGTARKYRATLTGVAMIDEPDITAAEIDGFVAGVTAFKAIQDEQARRQRATPPLTAAQRKSYKSARENEHEVIRQIRWAFRTDRRVLRWCRDVLRGVGVPDLRGDLTAITDFVDANATKLAPLTALAARLRLMTADVATLPAEPAAVAADNRDFTQHRDAAYTALADTARRLCAAGSFAFDANPAARARFAKFRAGRTGAKKTAKPVTPPAK